VGERNTVQRQIIIDTLKSVDNHPSVDELYSMIQEKHPSISKATVYRNVRQLADRGIILQIAVTNDVSRYDGCATEHYHFICESCGQIFDINIGQSNDSDILSALIQDKSGHKVNRCMTSFFGECTDCINKE